MDTGYRGRAIAVTLLLALTGADATAASAASTDCKPVFDAMEKMAGTPNHLRMHRTAGFAGPSDSESITTPDAMYVQVKGAWHRTPYDAQHAMADLRAESAPKNTTCTHLRDENVAGEDSAVYDTVDRQDEGETVNSRIWISKTRGLPVKQTIDMDIGGKQGKSHTDVLMDYADVKAPAGAS
jgi:hypothetical protein